LVYKIAIALYLTLMLPVVSGATYAGDLQTPTAQASNQAASEQQAKDAEVLYEQSRELIEAARYGFARRKFFAAVNLWKQSQQIQRVIEALAQTGELHEKAGRWQDAIECYLHLIKFCALPTLMKMNTSLAIAQLYSHLRQSDLAKLYYRQTLALAQQTGIRSVQASSLIGLAQIGVERGEMMQANSYVQRILLIQRGERDERAKAAMLQLIGNIYRRQGRRAEAQSAFEQALFLYRKSADTQVDQAQLLCELSSLHLLSSQNQVALDYAMQANNLAAKLKANEPLWRSWLALARAQRGSGQTQDARRSYYRAFSLVERQLIYFSSDDFRIGLLEARQATYRELADFLAQIGLSDEAFKVVEHARARATLELLAEDRRSEVVSGQRQALREISETIARLRTELRAAQLDGKQQVTSQVKLEELETRREEIRFEMQMANLKRFTLPATLKQVEQTMLRPNEIMLEFFLTEAHSYVWLITHEGSLCAPLPARQEIEKIIGQYLSLMAIRPSNMHLDRSLTRLNKLANELFELLLGRFAKQLAPGRSLIIVPDGLLSYLPFETLIQDGRYLIENHNIAYAPSASVFGLLRNREGKESAYQMELLAFGDPIFDSAKGAQPNKGNAYTNGRERNTGSISKYDLSSLPNTRDELLSIAEFFPPDRRRIYLGMSATEATLKRELMGNYRRLHLATHSVIDEKFPARSGVLLSLDAPPLEDGILEIDEIANLDLNCKLVVLSACRTGQGMLLQGEGVIGLARAFLYAGAHSVAVSLWNVGDVSAASLMKQFYKFLVAKVDAATALRQAKLELITSTTATRHPHYWAPFVLVGIPE
jgi:CHAT domain-containing protein